MDAKALLVQRHLITAPFRSASRSHDRVPRHVVGHGAQQMAYSVADERVSAANNSCNASDTANVSVVARVGTATLSLCLALSASTPSAWAYNVRLRDVENPAMQNGI